MPDGDREDGRNRKCGKYTRNSATRCHGGERMRRSIVLVACLSGAIALVFSLPASAGPAKKRICVVSSYHREYNWSVETNKGFCEAMLRLGYFKDKGQAEEYSRNDEVETADAIVIKMWLNAKKQNSEEEKSANALAIAGRIAAFKPDLILLGDDEAANYVGSKFLDSGIPVVFWGVDNTPVKYGLLESAERPGHNVTGVYQSGFYDDSVKLLKRLVPRAGTFALFTEDSASGRSHYKAIEYLAKKGRLPLELVETVVTNDFGLWQRKALELQDKVDAFFVVSLSTLKDAKGDYVQPADVVRWHLANVKVPEMSKGQYVLQGFLCCADDAGFNQGYEAVLIADDLLTKGMRPETYPPRTPPRGELMVNRQRAQMLGIRLTDDMGIEKYIEKASALEQVP
jgi:ABC-type uncharacterized transport system substrate-binding protein